LDPDRLVKHRPWLYHLTDPKNLEGIRRLWCLRSAKSFLGLSGSPELATTRRRQHVNVVANGQTVRIRDQAPLHPGNVSFHDGFSFPDLVDLINSFVFFWPGSADGPTDYGKRHFLRYEDEEPVLLRVRTADLITVIGADSLQLCAYNSGAPRCTGGKGSPRGPETFLPVDSFPRGVSGVVEVVVKDEAPLPTDVEIATHPAGPWAPFARGRL
jgi:uncharacterized protein DUF7002